MTAAPDARVLTIDVWSDIACPWCWIGERRLHAALDRVRAERPGVRVARSWRPFQLQPQLPPEGRPWEAFAREKFGEPARAQQMFAHVAAAGAPDGLAYRFDRITVAPNTADAHRLVLHAGAAQGGDAAEDDAGARALAMADALFAAYFAEGRNVSDREVLADVAAEQGLDRAAARAYLEGGDRALDLAASQREAARLGIRGVPFVVLDGRLAVSGAQPVELFERAVRAALDGEGA